MKKAPVVEKWLEIEETMLVDIPAGAKRPDPGKPWTYYLFGWDVEKRTLKSGVKEFINARPRPASRLRATQEVSDVRM